jgi:hypothetical protein
MYILEFSEEEIWKIFEVFYDWLTLMDKKLALKINLLAVKEVLQDKNRVTYNIERLEEISSMYELHYIEELLLFYNEVYVKQQGDSFNSYSSSYKVLQCACYFGLDKFSENFVLSQADFEGNLEKLVADMNDTSIAAPSNPRVKPAQMAFDYVKDDLNEEIKILTFTCKYIAIQASCYPLISKIFKEYLFQYASLTTAPTEDGLKELDITNPSFRVKRITKKRLNTFKDDLFTDISLCEKSNLITVKIELDPENETYLKELFKKAFLNHTIEKKNVLNNEWNIVREEAIRMMVDECIMPKQIADVKRFLKQNAEDFIIEKCRNEFRNLINVKPLSNGFENKSSIITFVFEKNKNTVS